MTVRTWPLAAPLLLLALGCSEGTAGSPAPAEAGLDPTPAEGGALPSPETPSDLVLGEYACDESHWDMRAGRMVFEQRGYFVLEPGERYRWLDDGGEGTFRYSPAEGEITWLTGPLADKEVGRTTYRRGESTTQVDLHFSKEVVWSCGHNLE